MATMKLKRCGIVFLLVATIALGNSCFLLGTEKNAYAALQQPNWNYSDCENIISFIDDNFTKFVDEYNKSVTEEEALRAESIEYSSIIWLVEDDNYGAYIDFDGENGYMVVTGDYNVYDLKVIGDYECLREIDDLYFSYSSGFLMKDEHGIFQKVICEENPEVVDYIDEENTIYPGQEKPGDGNIDPNKLSEYVSARYPGYNFVTKEVGLSKEFDYVDQFSTSYYMCKQLDQNQQYKGEHSEGNCALNSLYMTLISWQKHGLVKNLPTNTIDLRDSIMSDPLYNEYGSGIVKNYQSDDPDDSEIKYKKWVCNSNYFLAKIPVLYQSIRDYAVNQFSYTPESGVAVLNIPAIGYYIANTLYHNDITFGMTQELTYALSHISSEAVCLIINKSKTYKNHAVVVLGYHEYSCTTGWWIFSSTKFIYFYEIADGWSEELKIFDPNVVSSISLRACFYVHEE